MGGRDHPRGSGGLPADPWWVRYGVTSSPRERRSADPGTVLVTVAELLPAQGEGQPFDACEGAVQEALITAAGHWSAHGVPDNPHGWLLRTAARRHTDLKRSEAARRRREERVAAEPPAAQVPGTDDCLALLFLCCHPALTPASAIALTLRAVGGLTTAEIAAAYLVPEATMAQRISRAKQRLKATAAVFEPPAPGAAGWSGRLRGVLHVLYLMFGEMAWDCPRPRSGAAAGSGPGTVRQETNGQTGFMPWDRSR